MKIAILGSRGIPCRMGGFERYAEEIGSRLAGRGHEITVYCENANSAIPRPSRHRGVRLIHLPHLSNKSLEAFSFDLLSCLHSAFCDYDVVYMLGFGWGYFCVIPRLAGKKIVINMDGMEWLREKWSWFGKTVLVVARNLSLRVANISVCDSRAMMSYYKNNFRGRFQYLSYGAEICRADCADPMLPSGLIPNGYLTVVCRFEPENNLKIIVQEYLASDCRLPLVVIGGSTYKNNPLTRFLDSIDDPRVVRLGVVSDQDLLGALRANARAHIHGHEVGGTNPSLLDAMGCGNLILALDVPYNREVLGDAGLYFSKESGNLCQLIGKVVSRGFNPDELRRGARERIKTEYDWDNSAKQHENFFRSILRKSVDCESC